MSGMKLNEAQCMIFAHRLPLEITNTLLHTQWTTEP